MASTADAVDTATSQPHLCWRCHLRLNRCDFAQLMLDIAAAGAAQRNVEASVGTDDGQDAKRAKLNKESDSATDPSSEDVCSACLGILPTLDRLDSEVCDPIAEAVSASGHTFVDFKLLVSSPIVCLLRDHAWRLAMPPTDPATAAEAPLAAKDVWKALAKQAIERRLLPDGSRGRGPEDSAEVIPLQLSLEFRYPTDAEESDQCLRRLSGAAIHGASSATRHGAAHAVATASAEAFRAALTCPPPPPTSRAQLIVAEVSKDLMFVGGRYRKLCRRLPQTPWILDGERRMDTSVEELISPPIVRLTGADSASFASAGREDVDVRMLGRGRPFLLRLANPRAARLTLAEAADLQARINAADQRVQVSHLRQVSRAHCESLREGESEKVKCYSALCRCTRGPPIVGEDLDRLRSLTADGLVLEQATPIRVLHRRTAAVRKRRILSLDLEPLPAAPNAEGDGGGVGEGFFRLRLRTEAGAYVKEFVHGDLGRTRPSLGELLGAGRQCDLLLLDVVDVELDWPEATTEACSKK